MMLRVLIALYMIGRTFGMGSGPIRTIPKLIRLVQKSPMATPQIIDGIEQIARENKGAKPQAKTMLQRGGTWKLLWTTEKEINFFYSWPFSKVDRITQSLSNGDLIENLIEFEDGGFFSVEGSCCDISDAPSRTAFSFEKATVRFGQSGPKFVLPPIGKGSFRTLYMNDRYRLSRDETRGDYSIFEWEV